jgi:hypothetical protein
MSQAITKFQDSSVMTQSIIVVGDTVNGRPITEIWISSIGTPLFTIDGEYYSWTQLHKILPDGKPIADTEYVTEEEFNMSEEEYKTATSGE